MPLSAIKQKLDSASDLSTLAFEVGLLTDAPMKVASKETRQNCPPGRNRRRKNAAANPLGHMPVG